MMKLFLLALFNALTFASARSIPFTERDLASEESLWDLYERWCSHHTVSRDLDEKEKRFNVFKENVRYIHESKKNKPYKMELNKFGDMTKDEIRHSYTGSRINHHKMRHQNPHNSGGFMHANARDLPPSIDSR